MRQDQLEHAIRGRCVFRRPVPGFSPKWIVSAGNGLYGTYPE